VKIGTTEKLKFKNLQRRLRLPLWQAVGLLETLWKVAYRNAPAGDIGKLTNDELAGALEWDGDADELIDALTDSKWLDRDSVHRLLIHDWEHECEAWLRGNFEKNHKKFARPTHVEATKPSTSLDVATKQPTEQPATKPSLSYLTIPSPPLPPLGATASWDEVEGELRLEGVELIEEVTQAARARGHAGNAMDLIRQWQAWKPAFGVGLLVSKLRNMQPERKINWPEPPESYRQELAKRKSVDLERKTIATRANGEKIRAQNQAEAAELERDYGDELNKMPKAKVRELAELVFPYADVPKRGPIPSGLLRTALLMHLSSVAKQPPLVSEGAIT
jgi:hypothetical protein